MHLVIDNFGSIVIKKRERVIVKNKGRKKEIPVKEIKSIIISKATLVSSELLKYLSLHGIPIVITSSYYNPLAIVYYSKIGGNVNNRIALYKKRIDNPLEVGKIIISGKLNNQISNLKYYWKSRREERLFKNAGKIKEIKEELEKVNSIDELRGKEGNAANVYWNSLSNIFKEYNFNGREQEGKDLINVLLNVGYNLLSIRLWINMLYFSLDPFLGFVHSFRSGKLSLLYDVMEPLRPFIDRFVFSFIRKNMKKQFEATPWVIINNFRDKFLNEFLERKHQYKYRKVKIDYLLFMYVQDFVSFLYGKEKWAIPYLYW